LVEIDIYTGALIATLVPPFNSLIIPFPASALFGITIGKVNGIVSLVYVDDVDNAVNVINEIV